jgi:hypothetical protein
MSLYEWLTILLGILAVGLEILKFIDKRRASK